MLLPFFIETKSLCIFFIKKNNSLKKTEVNTEILEIIISKSCKNPLFIIVIILILNHVNLLTMSTNNKNYTVKLNMNYNVVILIYEHYIFIVYITCTYLYTQAYIKFCLYLISC